MIRKCTVCEQENELPPQRLMASANCGGCDAALAPPSEPLVADESNLDAVIEGTDLPVLVDFWAPWCAPCQRVVPELEKVAKSMAGEAVVLTVNIDRHPDLAARYQVRSIPNLVFFAGGAPRRQHIGPILAEQMEEWLRAAPLEP